MSGWFLVVGELAALVRTLVLAMKRGDVEATKRAALELEIAAEREAVRRARSG